MRSKLICGLMSGTSLDGVDAVLVRLRGSGRAVRIAQVAFATYPYPPGLRRSLLRNSSPETSSVEEIARLNVLLGTVYADAVRRIARKARVRLSSIDLIGSHGQTIGHFPKKKRIGGSSVAATIQIGDPSVLATLTGIPTVGDFRVADMAVGGQGAPLVPYADWLLFRSASKDRIMLNIGGIANVTVLKAGCRRERVIAFDTGPGNMAVDILMHDLYRKPFDRDGRTAFRGEVRLPLLRWMMRHPYFRSRPPKSTGREEFGDRFVHAIKKRAGAVPPEDLISTVSFLTPLSVYEACKRFVRGRTTTDQLIVSGGGARNRYFLHVLQILFGEGCVSTSGDHGMDPDAKEAICFALLAHEAMAGRSANIPGVTGARKDVVLGKICKP